MNYCLGKLKSSPWSELDSLQPETKIINEQLGQINLKGFITINSQPAVNGEKSDSLTVGEQKVLYTFKVVNFPFPSLSITFISYSAGWGGPGGYVYQKAYLEFFCSKDKLDLLVEKCKALPSVTYIAVNKEGQCVSNVGPNTVNAVTWGVFPGKEIIQPTIVDLDSFIVWKDEAFEIWTCVWGCLFPEGDSARGLLEQVTNLS